MPSCAVSSCKNKTSIKISPVTNVKPTLHTFPNDPIQAKRWLDACKRSDHSNVDFKTARVCSDHFEEIDYEQNLQAELLNLNTPRKLKKDAVPSLYLPKNASDKKRGSSLPKEIVHVQPSSSRNVSRQKRIDKRDRKKLVESLINESTTQKREEQDDLAHCIDLKGLCIFCLDNYHPIHHEKWKIINQLEDFSDIWPWIQPNWNENVIPGYAFLNWRSGHSKIPPMCFPCQDQVVKLAEQSRKISALKLELEKLETEVKRLGLELQRKTVDSLETPSNLRIYASRYKTLLVELVKYKASSKVMSNTIVFLNQLRGSAVEISEEGDSSIAPVPQEFSGIQTPCILSPAGVMEAHTANTRHSVNSLHLNAQLIGGCSVDLSRDNLVNLLVPATTQAGNRSETTRQSVNANSLTSKATLSKIENTDTDTVKDELEPKVEVDSDQDEIGEESDHFGNLDTCDDSPEEDKPGSKSAMEDPHNNGERSLEKLQNCVKPSHQNNAGLNPEETESHLREQHQVQEVVSCQFCPLSFTKKEDLIQHIVIHIKEFGIGIPCDICNTVLLSELTEKRHYYNKHGIGKKIMCLHESCDLIFFTESDLNKHVARVHNDIQHCPMTILSAGSKPKRSKLKPVRKEMNNEQRTVLQHCLKEMKKVVCTATENGVTESSPQEPHKCHICQKSFRHPTRTALKQHLRLVHKQEFNDSEKARRRERDKTKTTRYKCSFCGKSFRQPYYLRHHVKHHHEGAEGEYVCDVCGKRFTQSGGLYKHKRIHTGERPFQCHICGQRFRTRYTLQKHLMSKLVHKEMEKADENDFVKNENNLKEPHQCHICGKGFRFYYTLKKHKFLHHHGGKRKRGRPVGDKICDVCGAQFRNNCALMEHKSSHTGERSHQCHICGHKFRYKRNLWKHLSKFHKERVKGQQPGSSLFAEK